MQTVKQSCYSEAICIIQLNKMNKNYINILTKNTFIAIYNLFITIKITKMHNKITMKMENTKCY